MCAAAADLAHSVAPTPPTDPPPPSRSTPPQIFVFDLEGIDDLDELVPSDDDESEGIAALREEFENDDFDDGEFDVDADGDDGEDAPENDGGSAGAAAPDGGDGAEGASVESGGSPSGARKRRASGAPTAGSAGSDADPPESGASSPASGEGERRKRLRRRDADDASEGDDAVEPVKGFRQETLEATLRRARWTKLRRYDNYYDDGRLSEKTPAAFLAWELVKAACSSTRRDLLWFAIVGTTAQFLSEKLSRPRYDSLCVELKRDVISTAPVVIASDETGVDAARALAGREGLIEDEPFEPRFVAHRHWSLIESMRCSEYISTRLDTWKIPNMGEPSELDMLIAKTNTRVKVADASFAHVSRADRASFFQNLKRQISTNSRWRMHECVASKHPPPPLPPPLRPHFNPFPNLPPPPLQERTLLSFLHTEPGRERTSHVCRRLRVRAQRPLIRVPRFVEHPCRCSADDDDGRRAAPQLEGRVAECVSSPEP